VNAEAAFPLKGGAAARFSLSSFVRKNLKVFNFAQTYGPGLERIINTDNS